MGTFKAYFQKEILESKRQYKYLIVFIAFLFIALSNPIMLKLLPKILESSGYKDLALQMPTDKIPVMQNLMKDLFQTGVLVMVFTFCGVLSDELNNQKFVFPFSKGAEGKSVILAKTLHYSLLIIAAVAVAVFTNYYYVDLMFEKQGPPISGILFSILLISLFFIVNFMLTMTFSLLFRKGIFAGIVVAIIQFFSTLPAQINAIKSFIPYNLLNQAGNFKVSKDIMPIIVALIYIVVLIFLNIWLLRKKEIIK